MNASEIARNYFDFLDTCTTFVQDHYSPFDGMTFDQVRDYLSYSYFDNRIMPVIIGDEIVALYEYWKVTQAYLDKLEDITDGKFLTPAPEDLEGDILFCPLGIINQNYLGKGFGITRLATTKMGMDFPNHDGIYRWVLKTGRLGYLPFRRE